MVRFRSLIPGPGELVFALVLLFILIGGWHALFNDPGTLWHLRLGRDILAAGDVPRCDLLTSTRAQTPWVDQSWAFDVLLALTVDTVGWSGAVAFTAVLLAAVYAKMTTDLIRDGNAPVVAVVVALLMSAIGCIHFLIRPHVFTIVLVYLTFRACQRQHEGGGWSVAWVPVFTALLANIHGGFVALPVIVATAAAGHTIAGPWDTERRNNLLRFGAAFIATCLAALINPYGFGLYRHVGHLLVSSGVTSLIDEYQSAPFGKPQAQVLEMALLALVALPSLVSRRVDRYHLVHLLVWLHLALTSIRNAPLFALAAASPLATLLNGLPLSHRTDWSEPGRRPLWIPGLTTVLALLVVLGVPLGGFDVEKWPLAALPVLNRQPLTPRLFHEQDWGGLVEAETQPVRRAYLDDRFELYGKDAILEYIDVLTGGPVWDTVRDRDGIALVWLRPDRGLARRLARDKAWRELYRDGVSVLFARQGAEGAVSMAP